MEEKKKEIRISVRNLVEFILRSGDLDNSSGGFGERDAMQAGTRVHQQIQKKRGADYRAEVPLVHEKEYEHFILRVEGRADGMYEDGTTSVIEEIKGTYRDLKAMEEPVPVHLAQAKCYAYIYGLQNRKEEMGVLMTYTLLSSEEEGLLRPLTKEEVKPEPSTGGAKLSQEEIERLMSGGAPSAPPPASSGSGKLSQEEIEQLMSGMAPSAAQAAPPRQPEPQQSSARPYEAAGQYMPAPPAYAGEPRVINTKPVQLPPLDVADKIGQEQAQNLELIMSVPLEVSVEIGRTRRKVEDILTFSKGSLVVLDKLAGDQVDLFVNGLCVARGDVVVIDDNFGIRITEVLKRPELSELTRAD